MVRGGLCLAWRTPAATSRSLVKTPWTRHFGSSSAQLLSRPEKSPPSGCRTPSGTASRNSPRSEVPSSARRSNATCSVRNARSWSATRDSGSSHRHAGAGADAPRSATTRMWSTGRPQAAIASATASGVSACPVERTSVSPSRAASGSSNSDRSVTTTVFGGRKSSCGRTLSSGKGASEATWRSSSSPSTARNCAGIVACAGCSPAAPAVTVTVAGEPSRGLAQVRTVSPPACRARSSASAPSAPR